MKRHLRASMALLLAAVLALALFPAAQAAGTELWRWTASELAADQAALVSNLTAKSGTAVRWNSDGVLYGDAEKTSLKVHTFMNTGAGRGTNAYGLPHSWDAEGRVVVEENLMVDAEPRVAVGTAKAAGLRVVYAWDPSSGAANAASRMQFFVTKNGTDWAGPVSVRSARVLGGGTVGKKSAVFYEIWSDDLLSGLSFGADERIRAVRVMPDGLTGVPEGEFSLCEIALTGYADAADLKASVPAAAASQGGGDLSGLRASMVDAAKAVSGSKAIDRANAALAVVSPVKLTGGADAVISGELCVTEGVQTQANELIKEMLDWFSKEWKEGSSILTEDLIPAAQRELILQQLNTNRTTEHILKAHNTPQQIMQGYASAKAGDLLVSVKENESGLAIENYVFVIADSKPVYMADDVTIDPNRSAFTYLDGSGKEQTKTYAEAFVTDYAVPYTLKALADDSISLAIDAHLSFADGVRVTAASAMPITACAVSIEGQNGAWEVKNGLGAKALTFTDAALTEAVAALPDGDYVMNVSAAVASAPQTAQLAFAVKSGKAEAVRLSHEDTCPSKAMTDVDKAAWYHEAVDWALTQGVMAGYSATTFGPNNTLTRAMVVQVLYNKEGQPSVSDPNPFSDVPADQWYFNAVRWGAARNVVAGYGGGVFKPDDNVTLEQVAVILHNYSGKPAGSGDASGFGAHSDWAEPALKWAAEKGVFKDMPAFTVTGPATRAQTALMLMNYMSAI